MNETNAYTAIADANRRHIMDLLRASGPLCASDIVAQLSHISQPAVSRHLRVLREAELVRYEKQGRERQYRLNPQALQQVVDWLRHYEALWDTRLETLKQLAEDASDSSG